MKLDGGCLVKVHLDRAQQNIVEHRVKTFSAVCQKLPGKDADFESPGFHL